jgi:hypothetical protein
LLFSLWVLACSAAPSRGAWPQPCLPPLFEAGQRLHPAHGSGVLWLELALRQHEVCWREPSDAGEKRIAVVGNSAIFGFPLPVEQSFAAQVNRRFAAQRVPAHLFNLGWIFTYQLRDALILHEALRYAPDVIVYPLTLDDFIHHAPAFVPPQLVEFFERNTEALAAFAAEEPPGLVEPLERYQPVIRSRRFGRSSFEHLREAGTFARLTVRQHAASVAQQWAELPPLPPPKLGHRRKKYDCAETFVRVANLLPDWSEWNVIAYLEQIRRDRGIEVLVINWPVEHWPIGDCYNARYSNAGVEEFNRWIAEQTRTRGLRYLDLHDLLAPDGFIDSLHLTAAGHQQVAAAVADALLSMLAEEGP